jgi:hypothetical protein
MLDHAATQPALPDGWEAILDNIAARLQEAVAAADARAALLPSANDEPASVARRGELAALADRAQGLGQRVAQAVALATEADAGLAAGEEFLRWRLTEAESLRERVAAWRQSIG